MKKSFVVTLALVFVLGIAGTAFAANPFTDVPANHWAYASVSKLAQAGIVDGYGDGKFIGSSNMTRFEMAQIIAKAMANSDKADAATKAQIEKLAAEFSAELNKLGVRVSTLEKKVDNVKITGEVRFSNYSYSNVKENGTVIPNSDSDTNDKSNLRTRLWLTGQVNDSWKYTAMLENTQKLQTNNQDATTEFRRAWVEGKIGAIGVTAGRFNYLSLYGTVLDDASDGLVLNYTKNKFSMDVFALRPTATNIWFADLATNEDSSNRNTQVYGAQINYNFDSKWHAGATYYDIKGVGADTEVGLLEGKINTSIFELGVDYKFDKNWFAWAQYIKGGKLGDKALAEAKNDDVTIGSSNGWAAGVNFGNTDRNKPGSYQIRAAYYDVPALGSISTTIEFSNFANAGTGFKGYNVGASYMVAKNIDVNVDYFDFKTNAKIAGHKADGNLLWSYVRFYF